METQNRNRKLLDEFPSGASPTITAAEAAAPSSKSSKEYYNYPRPYLIPMGRSSNEGNETSSNQPDLSRFDSSMALTVVILLTVLFFMGFFSVYIQRLVVDDNSTDDNHRRRHQQGGRRGSSSSGLDTSVIQSLPLFAYDDNIKETLDCPICLSEFEDQEPIKMIPFCGHFFHPQCIDMWFSAHVSCPLCRSTQLLAPPPPRDGKGGGGGMEEPVGGGHSSVLRTSTDVQSSVSTSINNTECVECRQQREAPAPPPPPPSLDANATRVNSFSSLTSSIFGENRERVFGLPRPRSSTF